MASSSLALAKNSHNLTLANTPCSVNNVQSVKTYINNFESRLSQCLHVSITQWKNLKIYGCDILERQFARSCSCYWYTLYKYPVVSLPSFIVFNFFVVACSLKTCNPVNERLRIWDRLDNIITDNLVYLCGEKSKVYRRNLEQKDACQSVFAVKKGSVISIPSRRLLMIK